VVLAEVTRELDARRQCPLLEETLDDLNVAVVAA
jgi:hypothetical protein